MNVLQLIQKFALRVGLAPPVTVLGTTDNRILQILNLLEEEVKDLTSRHNWQVLNREAVHTTINNEDQGNINTLDPGFQFIRNNTIWDTTDRLPVLGPLDGQQWQALKAILATGPRYRFRFRGDHLLVNPVPAAGHIWKFEYQSKWGILDADGITLKEYFTADTDTFLLQDSLHLSGLRWRWLSEKGLSYAEQFNMYEAQVKDAMGRDGGRDRVHADDERKELKPGIFIPAGSWTVL